MSKSKKETESAVSFDKPAQEIEHTNLAEEISKSFLEYSYSVIYSRALPDARDGLKPVHRRILYTMIDNGYTPEKPHVKSARIVGTTMGLYHPHGDCLSGDTLIIDNEGNNYTLEELALTNATIQISAVNKQGQIVLANAHSFRVGQMSDTLYHITMSNGHKVTATGNHPFLASDGSWVKAKDLEFGVGIRSAFYNPSQPALELKLNNVESVTVEKLASEVPMYDFTVDKHENLFIAYPVENGYSLLVAHNSAIYEAMVRLAQPFSMRVPLVDGHGNFGGTPDDSAASSRYTEARLSKEGASFIGEIKEEAVDFVPNFDSSTVQPTVFPATFPNLLINGTSGIAVGMATNMPPHNPNEIIDACKLYIKKEEVSLEELMEVVKGPDFPTGGLIVGADQIKEAYSSGKGIIKIRARIKVEPQAGGKNKLIVFEHPYQIGFEKIISSIKDEIGKKRVQGISRVIDLTDRRLGTHLVIDLKSGFNPQTVISSLYRYTPLETSFGIQNLALVEGQPKYLGLKELISIFVNHRREVITRRTTFRKNKREARLHLVKGLILVLSDIDKAIHIIRNADDVDVARSGLSSHFKIDEIQSDYILGLQLRRLTKYDTLELQAENEKLIKEIEELNKILASQSVLDKLLVSELDEIQKVIGDERRSEISDAIIETYANASASRAKAVEEQLDLPEETIYMNSKGQLLSEAAGVIIDTVTFKGTFLGITKDGQAHRMRTGDQYPNLIGLAPDMPFGNIAVGTKDGIVKLVAPDYPSRQDDFPIITLAPKDEIVGIRWIQDAKTATLVFISSDSSLLKFPADKVRAQGAKAGGVAGMSLVEGSAVISFNAVSDDTAIVATFTGESVKQTPLKLYPPKGRGGKGVRSHKFLKGEESLTIACVSDHPTGLLGVKVVKLPPVVEKRDGSGTKIALNGIVATIV